MAYLCQPSLTGGYFADIVDGRRLPGAGLRIRPIDESEYFDFTDEGKKFKIGVGRAIGWDMTDNIAVRAEDLPTKMKLWKSFKKLPCMFVCGGPWMVCNELRTIVERLEPNVHQFFPIDVLDRKDQVVDERLVFNICKRLDALDALDEQVSEFKWMGVDGYLESKPSDCYGFASPVPDGNLFVRRSVVEGHHFWGDKWMLGVGGRYFCSDEAQKAIKDSKLRKIRFTPVGET